MNALTAPAELLKSRPLSVHRKAPGFDSFAAACERLETIVRRNMQASEADAGLTRLFCALCLASGIDLPINRLAAALPVSEGGFDVDALLAAMANLGFSARRIEAPGPDMAAEGPLLLLPRSGDPAVVFSGGSAGGLSVARLSGDIEELPSGAPLGQGASAWAFRFGDIASPLDKAQRSHTGHSWFRSLLSLFDGFAPVLFACTLALAMLATAIPLFTIYAYQQVISPGQLTALPGFVTGVTIVIALEAILLFQRGRIIAFVANRLEYLVATASLDRILKIRPALSDTVAVADQAARLRSFDNVRGFLTSPSFTGLLEAPASVVSLVAIYVMAGWVALVPAAGIVLHLTVFALVRRRARVTTRMAADAATEMQRIAIDTFEKRGKIRDAGIQHKWSERMAAAARQQEIMVEKQRMVAALGEALSACVLTGTAMLLLGAGAEAAWAGTVGASALLAIMMLGLRALAPFHLLCLSLQRFEQVRNSVNQVNSLMDLPPERDADRLYGSMKAVEGSITFVNTGHRMRDTRPVFVGLDMEIAPGSVVAVTGASGSGKTSVLKLIQGMTDLSIGTVRIDGVDLRQLPADELRRRISYVPQRPCLFPGSLRDNLLLANPLASDEKIDATLAWVGLTDEIAALPCGLDGPLGPAGLELATGPFGYRFAIAQALLVGSRIILIDEIPNAVLDAAVGDVVRKVIGLSAEGRTVIFVSQRSDFLELAGRVIALRYGRAPTIATPTELLARSR